MIIYVSPLRHGRDWKIKILKLRESCEDQNPKPQNDYGLRKELKNRIRGGPKMKEPSTWDFGATQIKNGLTTPEEG